MNIVFGVVVTVGIVLLAIADPASLPAYLLEGTTQGVNLALKLLAVYALWMGILHLASRCGLDKGIAKLYSPLLRRAFPAESNEAISLVGLNLTANLLGLGAAATPLGIRAMQALSRGQEKASDNMILFFVLNVTAVQLLPGTVIALRAATGSASAASVFVPCLVSSLFTALSGVSLCLLCRVFRRLFGRKKAHTYGAKPHFFARKAKERAHNV